ncbi:chaperonin 10-like protein [Chytridium lagenaria]|nr:chaperonin 10-like protein [Chytridium lagenaria]
MSSTIPPTIKAAAFSRYGGPEVLDIISIPTPQLTPTDDAVLIKVSYAGINPVDYKVREGHLSALLGLPFPAIVGIDYSGVIASVGPKAVGDFKVGDQVYGKLKGINGKGTYAEYIRVSTKDDIVVKRPDHISAVDAAGVGVTALTAYVGLVSYGGLSLEDVDQPVGPASKSVAKKLGAKVTAVASGKNKDYVVNTLKADVFVDYTVGPIDTLLTTEAEFDVVFDAVGGDQYWTLAQKILKAGGLFTTAVGGTEHGGKVTFGALAGMVGSLAWRSLTNSRKYRFVSSLPVDQFPNVAKWIEDGSVKLPPSTVVPLAEVRRAHELSASHRTVGKIILEL